MYLTLDGDALVGPGGSYVMHRSAYILPDLDSHCEDIADKCSLPKLLLIVTSFSDLQLVTCNFVLYQSTIPILVNIIDGHCFNLPIR